MKKLNLLCILGYHKPKKVYKTKKDITQGTPEIHCDRCKKVIKDA